MANCLTSKLESLFLWKPAYKHIQSAFLRLMVSDNPDNNNSSNSRSGGGGGGNSNNGGDGHMVIAK